MNRVILAMLCLSLASARAWADERAEQAADERVRFLISCLDRRIPMLNKGDVGLEELLETMMKLGSEVGFEKDPKKRLTIVVDSEEFKREWAGMFDLERHVVRFGEELTNVRLESVLYMTATQLGGAIFVRNDYIEIVPHRKACGELGLNKFEEKPIPRLVDRVFSKVSLQKALELIAQRYNQNIVVAPQAEPNCATVISARLVNVPVDAAVETLANLADLKVVRKANVLYVTTKEQAAQLQAE